MSLNKIINGVRGLHRKLSKKFDHLYYASLAFLATRGLDAMSTSLCCHKYSIDGEQNEAIRHCMERFGINTGLMIHMVPWTLAIIGAGYWLNKAAYKGIKRVNPNCSNERLAKNIGSAMIYGISVLTVPVVINNFAQYFQ